jgi:hypothetical protein
VFYPYRLVYAGKVFRFKEIEGLDVSHEEIDYRKAPRTSLSEIVTGHTCEDRTGYTLIMRFGEVHEFMAFPRLSAQIDLMVAEPEEVTVQLLDVKGEIDRTYHLHCATPVKVIGVTTAEEGKYLIGTMLWTVKKVK